MAEDKDFGQKIPAEVIPEPEVIEPTIEEKLAQAVKQTEEAVARADKAEKSTQGLRGSLQEKENKLREQASSGTRLEGIERRMEILALAMDKGLSASDIDGEKLNLRQEFADLEKKQADAIAQEKIRTQQEDSFKEADALWSRAQEYGTYQDNDDVAEVYDALFAGNKLKAERLVKKLDAAKPDTKKEANEPTLEEQVTERLRQEMEKRGLLRSDNGAPAGETTNDDKIKENYRKNPNNKANRDAYLELQRKIRGS